MPRQYPRLLVSRLDQAVTNTAMFGAFAEREDIRCAGLQGIVDDDAAIDGNAGLFRQCNIRPDARRENHRVGIDPASVRQFDAVDARLTMEPRGIGIQQNPDALKLDQGFQQFRGWRIELALHQAVHQMDQRHRGAGFSETVSRLQPQQSAADHDDALPLGGEGQQQVDVPAVAKGVHAGEIGAGHAEPQRH